MRQIIGCLILCFYMQPDISAQGCVAIRSNGNSCSLEMPGTGKGWQLNMNNRYFRSYKHYVGTIEQKQRVDSGTEVINKNWSLDLTLVRNLSPRWSLALSLPFISNSRSSKYEHYGNASKSPAARRSTRSIGIGDLRIAVYRWLLDPARSHRGNIQAGLGIKLPTGDFRYQDYFYRNDSTAVLGPVDQSIQLGDGGTGFTLETRSYYQIGPRWTAYADVFYLINPREQNGVSTARGGTPSANAVRYFSQTMSVPDQYMWRTGVSYRLHHYTVSGGLRMEGIPSSDLIGGDRGFRRPGYVIAAEPVLSRMGKRFDCYLAVPVALQRNRTQSYADKLITRATGVKAHGDAAFADYAVNIGCTFKF